jgi:hypothetical protein
MSMIGFEARIVLLGYALLQDGMEYSCVGTRNSYDIYFYPHCPVYILRIFIFEFQQRTPIDYSGVMLVISANVHPSDLETAKDFLDTAIFAWFVSPYSSLPGRDSTLGTAVFIAGLVVALVYCTPSSIKNMGSRTGRAGFQIDQRFYRVGSLIILCHNAVVLPAGTWVYGLQSYGLHPSPGVVYSSPGSG